MSQPSRHPVFAESLVGSIATGLLEIPAERHDRASGGLAPAQMRKLAAALKDRQDRRMTVAEMAATVGLSESWFAAVFKQTTGQTPLQWQLGQRIALADGRQKQRAARIGLKQDGRTPDAPTIYTLTATAAAVLRKAT